MKLVFLGKFRGLAREDAHVALPPDVRTLFDLKDWIARRDPVLGDALAATRTQLVLNHAVTHDLDMMVQDGDEIGFLPPMSGG